MYSAQFLCAIFVRVSDYEGVFISAIYKGVKSVFDEVEVPTSADHEDTNHIQSQFHLMACGASHRLVISLVRPVASLAHAFPLAATGIGTPHIHCPRRLYIWTGKKQT